MHSRSKTMHEHVYQGNIFRHLSAEMHYTIYTERIVALWEFSLSFLWLFCMFESQNSFHWMVLRLVPSFCPTFKSNANKIKLFSKWGVILSLVSSVPVVADWGDPGLGVEVFRWGSLLVLRFFSRYGLMCDRKPQVWLLKHRTYTILKVDMILKFVWFPFSNYF